MKGKRFVSLISAVEDLERRAPMWATHLNYLEILFARSVSQSEEYYFDLVGEILILYWNDSAIDIKRGCDIIEQGYPGLVLYLETIELSCSREVRNRSEKELHFIKESVRSDIMLLKSSKYVSCVREPTSYELLLIAAS